MSSSLGRNIVLAGVMVAACAGLPAHATTLRMCVDKANPLFTVDEAVGGGVAAAAGMTAVFVVRDSSTADQDEDSAEDQVKFFAALSAQCDLIMGFPTEAGFPHLPDGMAATLPYAQTGFVTATTGATATDFTALANHAKVGVVFLTVTETYFNAADMSHEHVYYTNQDLLAALQARQIDAALIWRPWLERELAAHPANIVQAKLAMPHADWDIVALYPAGPRTGAVRRFDAGIEALTKNGKLAGLVSPYGVPKDNN